MLFTLILGVFLQPDPIGKGISVRVLGISRLFDDTAQVICICMLLYSALNVLLSQVYCLIYRFSAIHESKRFQQFFVSGKAKFLCFIVGQVLSIGIGFLGYHVFVKPEVNDTID